MGRAEERRVRLDVLRQGVVTSRSLLERQEDVLASTGQSLTASHEHLARMQARVRGQEGHVPGETGGQDHDAAEGGVPRPPAPPTTSA